jgi:hypothetical protein
MKTPIAGIFVCLILLCLTSVTSLYAERRTFVVTEEAAEIKNGDKIKGHSIKIGAIYFNPSEQSFKEIYGSGFGIGGELNFNIWRSVDIWFIGSSTSSEGTLPYTQETTTMSILAFGGGLKLRLPKGSVSPYLGFGPLAHNYKEENPIGVADRTDIGFIGQLGCYFHIFRGLILDFALNYTHCVVRPQNIEANLGGLQAALRIGFTF